MRGFSGGRNDTLDLQLSSLPYHRVGKFVRVPETNMEPKDISIPIPLWIVVTDYTNYSVWAICIDTPYGFIGEREYGL